MNEAKIEQQRQRFVDRGVLTPDEKLFGSVYINYFERLIGKFGEWRRGGLAIFTDQKLILSKGLTKDYTYIPYTSIKEVKKCFQGFFPMGLMITYEDRGTREIVSDKISLGKRKKWLEILLNQTGLSV